MRKFLASLLLSLIAFSAVAQTTINNLPNGGLMQQTDRVPVWRGGVTYQTQPYMWPSAGGVMISSGTSAPQSIVPINGYCLVGSGGTWIAQACPTGPAYLAGTGLTLSGLTFSVNTSQNIATLSNLTANGFVTTSGADGTLGVDTVTQATAALNLFSSSLQGLVPASGGGTTNFLRADGTFAAPPASNGTVTSSGSPVSGNVAAFTTSTNIAPATASNVVGLFSGCSGSQYLGADGVCHSAAGAGTVTSITATSPLSGGTITTSGSIGIQHASGTQLGAVQGDASTLTINGSGVASCTTSTSSQIGCSKPDGTILTITAGAETVATATTSALGVVEIGSGLNVSAGIISLAAPTVSVLGGIEAAASATSNQFMTYVDTSGVQHTAQPSAANLSNGTTGTGAVVLAGSPTLTGSPVLATASASSVNVTGSSVPTNGVYLPSSNTVGISSNSQLVDTFNTPGSGGNYHQTQNSTAIGFNAVSKPGASTAALAGVGAGNLSSGTYSYQITFRGANGETAAGTTSNVITVTSPGTNGQIHLTGIPTSASSLLVSARNIYRTEAGGTYWLFVAQIADNTTTTYTDNIPDTTLAGTYSPPTTTGNLATLPEYSTTSASSADSAVGMLFNTIGTTTRGGQFNGSQNSASSGDYSGDYFFNINGNNVLQLTDTYLNPDSPYIGPPDGGVVISSGSSYGGVETSGIVSANIINPATANSASLRLNAKGPEGQIHFVTNGFVSASVAPSIVPTNPNNYNNSYYLNFAGVPFGENATPAISLQSSSGSFSDATAHQDFLFYDFAGDYIFTGNSAITPIFRAFNVTNAINQIYVKPSITGGTSLVGAGGASYITSGDANAPIGLTAAGTGVVDIFNGAGTNLLGQFANVSSAVDYLTLSPSATGAPGIVQAAATGTDSNISIQLAPKGSGVVQLASGSYSGAGTGLTGTASGLTAGAVPASGITGTVAATQGGTGQTSIASAFNSFFESVATTLGDTLYGGASGVPTRLAGNTTTTPEFLRSTGSGSVATAPAWQSSTGSGNVVLATSPTLVTPVLGAASASSVNLTSSTAPANGIYLPAANEVGIAANSILQVLFPTSATAVNLPLINGAATGGTALYGVGGASADANAGIAINTKGSGPIYLQSGSNTQVLISGSASSNSYLDVAGGTNNVAFSAQGGTNPSMTFYTGGSGGMTFATASAFNNELQLNDTALSVDYLTLTGGATGNPGVVPAAVTGSDTNITFKLAGKGTGTVQEAGHFESALGGTTAPSSITLCGTGSPTVTGTDVRGTITTGSAATTCTLNFGTSWNSAPYCVVSDNSLVGFASVTSTSTSAMVLGISAALTGGKITYICIQ